jgi:hypothetical protein
MMKKILIAAALGMLLSAVSVTAQDFDDWSEGTGEPAGLTELEAAQQRALDAETALEEAQKQIRDAKTKQNNAQQQADAARVQIEKERAAKERAQDALNAERAQIEKKEADLNDEWDRIVADVKEIEKVRKTVEQEKTDLEEAQTKLTEDKEAFDRELAAVLDKEGPGGVPLWVTNLRVLDDVLAAAKQAGVFIGIGSATSTRDYQAIQMAEARARQDIAFQRDALIKAEITDYAESMEGVKGQSNSLSSAAEEYIVGRQSVETKLPSATVVKRQKQPDTYTWWVVVTAEKPGTGRDPKNEAVTSPYETKVAPKAVGEMEQNLLDQRVGRNNLKPTVSPALSSEPETEAVIE